MFFRSFLALLLRLLKCEESTFFLFSSTLFWTAFRFAANAQLSPRQKLRIEQHRIAMPFATSSGSRAPSTSSRISARFPTIETSPLER
jgi:hypothetical protein